MIPWIDHSFSILQQGNDHDLTMMMMKREPRPEWILILHEDFLYRIYLMCPDGDG